MLCKQFPDASIILTFEQFIRMIIIQIPTHIKISIPISTSWLIINCWSVLNVLPTQESYIIVLSIFLFVDHLYDIFHIMSEAYIERSKKASVSDNRRSDISMASSGYASDSSDDDDDDNRASSEIESTQQLNFTNFDNSDISSIDGSTNSDVPGSTAYKGKGLQINEDVVRHGDHGYESMSSLSTVIRCSISESTHSREEFAESIHSIDEQPESCGADEEVFTEKKTTQPTMHNHDTGTSSVSVFVVTFCEILWSIYMNL